MPSAIRDRKHASKHACCGLDWSNRPGGEASFESVGLAVRDATGRDLVDREAAKKHPLLAPVIPGTVLLAEAVLPKKFSVFLPGVRTGSTVTHVPELMFERKEKKQCVPLFVNY